MAKKNIPFIYGKLYRKLCNLINIYMHTILFLMDVIGNFIITFEQNQKKIEANSQ